MNSLRRASGALFYLLGILTIASIACINLGIEADRLSVFLNVIDLPLLLSGMLFGGSSFLISLSRGKTSVALTCVVFIPLLILFGLFVWMNFALPFVDV